MSKKFIKKPLTITAEQWFPEVPVEGVRAISESGTVTHGIIDTLEGPMRCSPGDWVIVGIKGERYACKPDVFSKSYDPVDDPVVESAPSPSLLLG